MLSTVVTAAGLRKVSVGQDRTRLVEVACRECNINKRVIIYRQCLGPSRRTGLGRAVLPGGGPSALRRQCHRSRCPRGKPAGADRRRPSVLSVRTWLGYRGRIFTLWPV